MEAVKTNILGTENLIYAANSSNVKKIVFLSTDKAVNPINAMGMSKALMEKIILANSEILIKFESVHNQIWKRDWIQGISNTSFYKSD